MKQTKWLFIFTLFFQWQFAFGQLPEKVQSDICSARLKPIIGAGISNIGGSDDFLEYSSKPSVMIGVNVPMQVSERTQFIMGAIYETKGSVSSYEVEESLGFSPNPAGRIAAINNTNSLETRTTRSYFSLPWQIGVKPINDMPLNLAVGINNSILLSQKSKVNSFGTESTRSGTENLRKFNIGILLGVAYDITPDISAGILYDHGLTDINKAEGFELRDRTLRLTLAYKLHFNPIFWESYSRRGRSKMKMYQ